ncbi:MAG: FixH family protein [Vicinamibacterales bacterium]
MKSTQHIQTAFVRRAGWVVTVLAAVSMLTACGHAMMMIHGTGAKRPAATEFGLGPRTSAGGRYVGTLEPSAELRPRRMQTVRVTLRDADGAAVDGAQILVDGGMPQHGHGLPTKPRVTRSLGDGVYEIEGVRFNMGGWWEFRLQVEAARGVDTITFNLDL